jgi:hypothetical protein
MALKGPFLIVLALSLNIALFGFVIGRLGVKSFIFL